MKPNQKLIDTILKAVAVGMSVASLVLGILGTADTGTLVTLLSIGLFALSLAAFQKIDEYEDLSNYRLVDYI